jgi:hypothetical protein
VRINEITGNWKYYACRVRVVGEMSLVVSTIVMSDSRMGAVLMLQRLYGKNNVLSVNEITALNEKAYGATKNKQVMKGRPYSSDQLAVKSIEKKARDKRAAGDVSGAAVAKQEVAVQRAQIKKGNAAKDYTNKAHRLTMLRNG